MTSEARVRKLIRSYVKLVDSDRLYVDRLVADMALKDNVFVAVVGYVDDSVDGIHVSATSSHAPEGAIRPILDEFGKDVVNESLLAVPDVLVVVYGRYDDQARTLTRDDGRKVLLYNIDLK